MISYRLLFTREVKSEKAVVRVEKEVALPFVPWVGLEVLCRQPKGFNDEDEFLHETIKKLQWDCEADRFQDDSSWDWPLEEESGAMTAEEHVAHLVETWSSWGWEIIEQGIRE